MSRELNLPLIAQSLDFTCGAACFASMFQFLRGETLSELHFARELGALELGFTPPANVLRLALRLGFKARMKEQADFSDVVCAVAGGDVVFVTWWDEDAGHYSLIKSLDDEQILLMDPWTARDGKDNRLAVADFVMHWKARGATMISITNSPAATPGSLMENA